MIKLDISQDETEKATSYYSKDSSSISSLNEHSVKYYSRKYTPIFLRLLNEDPVEVGHRSALDAFIEDLINKDAVIASIRLNSFFAHHFTNDKVLGTFILLISRINNTVLQPTLITIATASLKHENIEVRENAIRCFENWGGLSSLRILQKVTPDHVGWLRDYCDAVIEDLKIECQITL